MLEMGAIERSMQQSQQVGEVIITLEKSLRVKQEACRQDRAAELMTGRKEAEKETKARIMVQEGKCKWQMQSKQQVAGARASARGAEGVVGTVGGNTCVRG